MSQSTASVAHPPGVLLRLAPFVAVIFFIYLTVGMPLAALPLQLHDTLGFGSLVIGSVIGLQCLATLATRQFAGTLCDRVGPKRGVLLGAAIAVVSGAVYLAATLPALGSSGALAVLLVARVISGIAESLVMTGSLSWSISTVGAANTGRAMVWVGIGLYAAIAVGAPVGIQMMHASLGGFAAVAVAIMACGAVTAAIASLIPPVAPYAGERLPFTSVVGRIAPFGSGLALSTIGFGAIGAFAALDFQSRGWSGAGFALTSFGVAYVLTRIVFGGLPDRFGGARIAAWSLLLELVGQLMLWLAPVPAVAFAGAILTGSGFSLVFPSLGVEAMKRVPLASRGAALGAYAAFFDIGFGVAGPVTGVIAGALGYPWVFAAGAVGAAAAMLAAWRATQREDAEATRV
jgi:MFS family permease